jgi:hypothetical protein
MNHEESTRAKRLVHGVPQPTRRAPKVQARQEVRVALHRAERKEVAVPHEPVLPAVPAVAPQQAVDERNAVAPLLDSGDVVEGLVLLQEEIFGTGKNQSCRITRGKRGKRKARWPKNNLSETSAAVPDKYYFWDFHLRCLKHVEPTESTITSFNYVFIL